MWNQHTLLSTLLKWEIKIIIYIAQLHTSMTNSEIRSNFLTHKIKYIPYIPERQAIGCILSRKDHITMALLCSPITTPTIKPSIPYTLHWRHNGRNGISNHQAHDCLLKCLFRRRSKKTSKLRITGLCLGNTPVTGEFPTQRPSNAENVFIWHDTFMSILNSMTLPPDSVYQDSNQSPQQCSLLCWSHHLSSCGWFQWL